MSPTHSASPTAKWLTIFGGTLIVGGLFFHFFLPVLFSPVPLLSIGLLQDSMLYLFVIGLVMVAFAYFVGPEKLDIR
jgi:hypothetical protein